jgi:antitoxin component YwqK of YwqJK toxin-antitoxin module
VQQNINSGQLQERNGLYYEKDSNKPYTGLVVDKYSNGQNKFKGTFKDGVADGKLIRWHENGQKLGGTTYKNNKLISEKK